jgi:hypothetical protein
MKISICKTVLRLLFLALPFKYWHDHRPFWVIYVRTMLIIYIQFQSDIMFQSWYKQGIVGPLAFSPRTEFEGLYLCGASTLSHGVAGVTQSGIDAAKAV